jgi:two-component system, response regulator
MAAKTILLIDDSLDDEELTRRALTESSISSDVVVAHDGVEALEYLLGSGAESRDLPQLTLLDLKLPGADGLEVLRRIRADPRTRILPVVVMTSSARDEDIVASYQLGASGYLRKPVDYVEFREVMRQLSHYWLVLNQLPPSLARGSFG